MFRRTFIPALAATLVLGACSDSPAEPAAEQANDFALVMFGEAGSALEGTMGPQHPDRPFVGRSGFQRLPDHLALSDEQRAEIEALRTAFRAEHQDEIDVLRATFEEARAARQDGASREEVREILLGGREIAIALRFPVWELHEAIRDVLTTEQKFWLDTHRRRMGPPMVPRNG
jgi:Spy/CpxP family protein refolding chaperone